MLHRSVREFVSRNLWKLLSPMYGGWLRLRGVAVGRGSRFWGLPIVAGPRGSITIGRGTSLVSNPHLATLPVAGACTIRTMTSTACVTIGASSGLTSTCVTSYSSVSVGDRVLCGAGVLILDSDAHELDAVPRRHLPAPASDPRHAIVIEDDVFIGARSTILKGVTIGRGSVIGAGSVVSSSIPPGVIAAGTPATVIRALKL